MPETKVIALEKIEENWKNGVKARKNAVGVRTIKSGAMPINIDIAPFSGAAGGIRTLVWLPTN